MACVKASNKMQKTAEDRDESAGHIAKMMVFFRNLSRVLQRSPFYVRIRYVFTSFLNRSDLIVNSSCRACVLNISVKHWTKTLCS